MEVYVRDLKAGLNGKLASRTVKQGHRMARMDDSDADGRDETFSIERHFCIVHQGNKWYPEVKQQGNRDFIKLAKWDRNFVKFALGMPMDLSKGVARSANSTLFEDLLTLRRNASVSSVTQQLEPPNLENESNQEGRRKKKPKVRDGDKCLVDPVITIKLPELEHNGEWFPSRPALVLFGVQSKELWIELRSDNLAYMKCLVKKGVGHVKPRKKRTSPKKKVKSPLKKSPKNKSGKTELPLIEVSPSPGASGSRAAPHEMLDDRQDDSEAR
eukprot:Skav235408  [mRNA]  locus=scaffold4571:4185:4997:- [translate_table: standard]